jgi:hypothetical protein
VKEAMEAAYNVRKVGLGRNVTAMVHAVTSDVIILVGVLNVLKAIIMTCVAINVLSFVKFVTDTIAAAKFVFQESMEKFVQNLVCISVKTPFVTRQLGSVLNAFQESLENRATKTVA